MRDLSGEGLRGSPERIARSDRIGRLRRTGCDEPAQMSKPRRASPDE
ncbi:hypothetical protein GLA29479_4363 [Lysobacter antibioticus]|nr:hypothetical protein GLA29479_4363 [Lysobacter antibioticus]